jgi:hypothetical protein
MPLTTVQPGMLGTPQPYNFKNRIINGAMVVNQRGGTVTAAPSGTFSVDRFRGYANGGGVFTLVQSSTVPTGAGFVNSNLLTVTTADSSIASGDYYSYSQDVEGHNIADLQWGTASAKTVTASFWVNSSVTGLYALALINSDGSRCYPATYTITSANTWQYVTLTVQGDTGGTWQSTNSTGLVARFDLGSGSNNNGTANTWNTAGGYAGCRTSSTVNWIATNGATFYITGVQIEQGVTATSFDVRSIGTELQLCQRYYTVLGGTNYVSIGAGGSINTTSAAIHVSYPVQMRVTPAASLTGSLIITDRATYDQTVTSLNGFNGSSTSVYLSVGNASGSTTHRYALLTVSNGGTGNLLLSAEL